MRECHGHEPVAGCSLLFCSSTRHIIVCHFIVFNGAEEFWPTTIFESGLERLSEPAN